MQPVERRAPVQPGGRVVLQQVAGVHRKPLQPVVRIGCAPGAGVGDVVVRATDLHGDRRVRCQHGPAGPGVVLRRGRARVHLGEGGRVGVADVEDDVRGVDPPVAVVGVARDPGMRADRAGLGRLDVVAGPGGVGQPAESLRAAAERAHRALPGDAVAGPGSRVVGALAAVGDGVVRLRRRPGGDPQRGLGLRRDAVGVDHRRRHAFVSPQGLRRQHRAQVAGQWLVAHRRTPLAEGPGVRSAPQE